MPFEYECKPKQTQGGHWNSTPATGFKPRSRLLPVYCTKFIIITTVEYPFCADRPCLEDRVRVQRVQRNVELGLTHILHRDNQESLMYKVRDNLCRTWTHWQTVHDVLESRNLIGSVSVPQLYQKMAVLRSLCSLHMEKLHWFSQRYPLTAHSLFPPLYKELFASEAELLPETPQWWFSRRCGNFHKYAKTLTRYFESMHKFPTKSSFLIMNTNDKSSVIAVYTVLHDFQQSYFFVDVKFEYFDSLKLFFEYSRETGILIFL